MSAASKPRDEAGAGFDPAPFGPAEPSRPERLLALATEIVDLDRLLKDLQARRDGLWQRFCVAAGPEPTPGAELVHVAVALDDAANGEPSDVLAGKVRWFFQQVREPIDAETVAVALGVQAESLPALRTTLSRLADAGEVKRVGRGQYVKGRGPEAK
jgi:hypothetical protein